jgi:phytoene dehydrogenase-like protein
MNKALDKLFHFPDRKIAFDAIIIGAGIGGLISGIELAGKGLRTLILERHFQPGGCCSSFKRKGFTFDAGAHLMGGVGNRKVLTGNYLSKLNLKLSYVQPDPWDSISFPNDRIKIPSDVTAYIAYLKKRFPYETHIDEFFKTLKKTLPSFSNPKSPTLQKYSGMTYQQMLDEFFEDGRLKSILSAQWGYLGEVPDRISAIAMSAMLNSYLFCGAYFPRGGSGAFARALAAKFEQMGGMILYSEQVARIAVKNGKVSGVVLDGGDEVNAEYVISNGAARHTFFDLIGKENLDEAYVSKVANMKESTSLFVTYLGVDLTHEEAMGKHGWYFDSDEMNSRRNVPLYVTAPATLDPGLAPQGKSIIQLYAIPPEPVPINGISKAWKEEWEKNLIKKAENIFPGLSNRIVVKDSATPKTIERYTLNSNGAVYGWSPIPGQSWKNNLENDTPIDGLYLAGHWSYPGTGIMSVISSGLIASKKIIHRARQS